MQKRILGSDIPMECVTLLGQCVGPPDNTCDLRLDGCSWELFTTRPAPYVCTTRVTAVPPPLPKVIGDR